MWAIIGGSGFEEFSSVEFIEHLSQETPFGPTSSGLRKIKIKGVECLFLPRHGSHHELLPSEINYAANIFALRKLGATQICSISTVGSLERDLSPGHLVIPMQYINYTKGIRKSSYCGKGLVGHVSLAQPVWKKGIDLIHSLADQLDFPIHFNKTYVCIEGPYFSTQAESRYYRSMGANIIGMTHFPEFALARELGLAYLPCCFVTDYDCWDDSIDPVTLQQVISIMKQNNKKALSLLEYLIPVPAEDELDANKEGLKYNLLYSNTTDRVQMEVLRLFET